MLEHTNPEQPLVSVIIPAYNAGATIEKAIQSVLHQTYPHFEIVVIDDGSTDTTPEILSGFKDPRLTVIQQPNQGVAIARNLGLAKAKGTYVAFLDSDDLWASQFLEASLHVFKTAKNPMALVYSSYYAIDDHERLIHLPSVFREQGLILDTVLANEGILLPSTTVVHREAISAIQGFPINSYHEDRVFFIRLCQQFSAYPTHQRLVAYRQSPAGRCRGILAHYNEALSSELSIIEALQPTLSQAQLQRLEALQKRNLFYRFLMYGYFDSAKQLFPQINPALCQGKKGTLAKMSMVINVNLLYWSRITLQSLYRLIFWRWWQRKYRQVFETYRQRYTQ